MASSGYYYQLYKDNRNAVWAYENDLNDLWKIHYNIVQKFDDEIRAVNTEIEELKSDLKKSIRYNTAFTSRANGLVSEKEKGVYYDPKLSLVIRELEEEISRINGLKNTAIYNRDYYYRQYEDKRAEEQREFFEKLF